MTKHHHLRIERLALVSLPSLFRSTQGSQGEEQHMESSEKTSQCDVWAPVHCQAPNASWCLITSDAFETLRPWPSLPGFLLTHNPSLRELFSLTQGGIHLSSSHPPFPDRGALRSTAYTCIPATDIGRDRSLGRLLEARKHQKPGHGTKAECCSSTGVGELSEKPPPTDAGCQNQDTTRLESQQKVRGEGQASPEDMTRRVSDTLYC